MEFTNLEFTNKILLFIKSFFQDPISRRQLFQFCGIGILNTVIGYGVYFILLNYVYYLVALLISHITAVSNSFLWNKFWVFKTKKIDLLEFVRFNLIYAIVLVANVITLFVSVDVIHVNPRLAQLILLPILTMVSFFGQKIWTFRNKIDTFKEHN